ncbi:MAG: glutamine synthetase [Gammaproteobacteria bacterium]|jgi:glutamine synthetase
MNKLQVESAAQVLALMDQRGSAHVKVGVFDIDGILRGKYMSRDKFASALDKGFGFCNVVLGWDSMDQLYDNVAHTGWHSGYPDASVRLLPETCRDLPLEGDTLFVLGEFSHKDEAVCPRACLRRVLRHAADMGFIVKVGFEYEFFMFEETPHSVRDKNYRGMRPLAPGLFGYSIIRSSVRADVYQGLLDLSEAMDFPLEGLHEETGPGVLEAAITVDEALAAADKAALFKTFTKIYAQQMGLMTTFMARWSTDCAGSSGHIHMSLTRADDGSAVFHDGQAEYGMSTTQRHFIGGLQRYMPEMAALYAPTVNSYRRLVPGFWAPTDASFGVDNRTCALRLVAGSATSQRVEYRVAGADSNPYLALAGAVASGLRGIEESIDPEGPVRGSAYEQEFPKRLALPRSLDEAARRFAASQLAQQAFGTAFVDHFAASRDFEAREFAKSVTDWELRRYFEII